MAAAQPRNAAGPLDQNFIFKRLAYASGAAPGFWWLRGTRYALVNGDLTPLWDMHIGTIFQVHERPEAQPGTYSVTSLSTSFYTDLHTGTFLREFQNPFTSKSVRIGYFPPKPVKLVYTAAGLADPHGQLPAAIGALDRIGPAWIEDDVISTSSEHLLSNGAGTPPIRVNDLTTYAGSTREVMNPNVAMPQANLTFSDINTWPPWLQMGGQPGNYYSRAIGRKERSYDALPQLWRSLMASEYPGVARDPVGALTQ